MSSWQVQALLAARQAGLAVRDGSLAKGLDFYTFVTLGATGYVRYDLEDDRAFPSLSGVALMLRRLLGDDASLPAIRALALRTGENLPHAERPWGKDWRERAGNPEDEKRARAFDPYAWYHATYGMFFQGGDDWERWNKALTSALVNLQDRDGAWRGSDKWSVKGGTVYSTALCVLCLQAPYRIQ